MSGKIYCFGAARDITGTAHLPGPQGKGEITVRELRAWLLDAYPAFGELVSFAIAVEEEYASDDRVIAGGETVAVIPPVSGG